VLLNENDVPLCPDRGHRPCKCCPWEQRTCKYRFTYLMHGPPLRYTIWSLWLTVAICYELLVFRVQSYFVRFWSKWARCLIIESNKVFKIIFKKWVLTSPKTHAPPILFREIIHIVCSTNQKTCKNKFYEQSAQVLILQQAAYIRIVSQELPEWGNIKISVLAIYRSVW
jgi:hypothetical protein